MDPFLPETEALLRSIEPGHNLYGQALRILAHLGKAEWERTQHNGLLTWKTLHELKTLIRDFELDLNDVTGLYYDPAYHSSRSEYLKKSSTISYEISGAEPC